MQSYLTAAGLAVLQIALGGGTGSLSVSMTGFQVGSSAAFIPDGSEDSAKGGILIDSKMDATAVRITKVNTHEVILTAIIDRQPDFDAVGNVLFFANNTPFLWLVSDSIFPKAGLDPVGHFAGDKCYLSIVFHFPFIQNMLIMPPENGLHALFPVFSTAHALTIPQHTLADQCIVEDNDLYYGQNKPFLAVHSGGQWLSLPLVGQPVDDNFYQIDGHYGSPSITSPSAGQDTNAIDFSGDISGLYGYLLTTGIL